MSVWMNSYLPTIIAQCRLSADLFTSWNTAAGIRCNQIQDVIKRHSQTRTTSWSRGRHHHHRHHYYYHHQCTFSIAMAIYTRHRQVKPKPYLAAKQAYTTTDWIAAKSTGIVSLHFSQPNHITKHEMYHIWDQNTQKVKQKLFDCTKEGKMQIFEQNPLLQSVEQCK